MRTYDKSLLVRLREGDHVGESFGGPVTLRRSPELDGHGYDPRFEPFARERLAARAGHERGELNLLAMRSHKGKAFHELSEGEVSLEERMIGVGGTHLIPVYVFRSERCEAGCPVLVYIHGGNFNAGDVEEYVGRMRLVSELAGAVVVFPAYRLAPECPYPAPVEDCHAAVEWAYEHAGEFGADASRLMVAGDSAGGSLANACVLLDAGAHIKRLVLVYPAADCGDWKTGGRYEWSWEYYQVAEGQEDLVQAAVGSLKDLFDLEAEGRPNLYVQDNAKLRDPLVSAVCAPDEALAAFPPTLVVTAEYDFMRVSAEWFAAKLSSLGVESCALRYEGLEHGFFGLLGVLPQTEDLCRVLAEELAALS